MENIFPNHTTDVRDIRKLFRNYAYPAMLNMIVLSLYNIVDRIFIGQGAGALAICGLALTLPCISLLGTIGTLTGGRWCCPHFCCHLTPQPAFSL